MTWLKLSDDYPELCAAVELSDAAFRTHTEALLWCMRRENGGHITDRDIRRFAESEHAAEVISELVNVGFWIATETGYLVLMHMEHQPEPEVIAARREAAAERQRRKRHKLLSQGESRRDSRGDNTRDPGRDGSGRVGTGREGENYGTSADDDTDDPWTSNVNVCVECGRQSSFSLVRGKCRTCHFGGITRESA